jgi:uncharacterized membrane protein YczE
LNLKKRIPVYILGLLVLAFGIVLVAKADIGIAPASAIPFAISKMFPLSFGLCTTLFHILCMIVQLAMLRKVTLQLLLQLPLAYVFGRVIDLYNMLLKISTAGLVMSLLLLMGGILFVGLGIAAIVGTNLMLTPPDAMLRAISVRIGWPLSRAKLAGDTAMVTVAFLLSLIIKHDALIVVGIGTVISMLLTGKSVGFFQKIMPFLDMDRRDADEEPSSL